MQTIHFTCDHCYETEIEDDALDWIQTDEGDICGYCQRGEVKPDSSFDRWIAGLT